MLKSKPFHHNNSKITDKTQLQDIIVKYIFDMYLNL